MIKKYAIYFAGLAAVIVFAEGFYVQLSMDALIFRTLIAFALFYVLGNMLGVITIEALLENQNMKIDRKKAQRRAVIDKVTPTAPKEPAEE